MGIENMTREDFKKLFDLKDKDEAMVNADACHDETGLTWFNIARMQIDSRDFLLKGM